MRKAILSAGIFGVLLSAAFLSNYHTRSATQPKRAWFASAMKQVMVGMPKAEVIQLLGQPDDIKTQHDPGGIPTYQTKEILGYGANGHLAFPTLGQVFIREDDRVQYVYGDAGIPPDAATFNEDELRGILCILNEVPAYGVGGSYNPRRLIKAVNTLQPLGKKKALAATSEYLRITSSFTDEARKGMFLVLRVLFAVPDPPGYMPVMRIGAWIPDPPKDSKAFPLFPLALQDDIPFHIAEGYMLAGQAEPPENHVSYFQNNGVLRRQSLKPTAVPLQAMEKLLASNVGYRMNRDQLVSQVAWLLDSVYHVEEDKYGNTRHGLYGAQVKQVEDALSQLSVQWDQPTQRYTLLDGTVLPPRTRPYYRRELWKPQIPGITLEITVERITKEAVSIEFSWQRRKLSTAESEAILRTYSPQSSKQTLDQKRLEYNEGTSATGMTVLLEVGQELIVEYKDQRTTITSLVYRP